MALAEAERMEAAALTLALSLRGGGNGLAGEVRLNMAEGLATFWLMPRMQPFQDAHSELIINWWLSNTGPYLDLGRDAEIGIWWDRPTQPSLMCRKLATVGYSLFAYPTYISRYGTPRSADDLRNHRVLHYDGYEVSPGLRVWNDLMRQTQPAMRIENSAVSQAALKAGSLMDTAAGTQKLSILALSGCPSISAFHWMSGLSTMRTVEISGAFVQ